MTLRLDVRSAVARADVAVTAVAARGDPAASALCGRA